MIVLAEPMSMAIESETRFRSALSPRKVLVLPMNDINIERGQAALPDLFYSQMTYQLICSILYRPIRALVLFPDDLLKRSACFLPVNFPKIHRLLPVLHHDWLAWFQPVTTVRRLRGSIANQNLTTARV